MVHEFADAATAVRALCACVDESDPSLQAGVEVAASAVPGAFYELLVHEEHMTPRLASFHGGPVSLEVSAHSVAGEVYTREILLRAPGGAAVEFGIVRLNLACTTKEVCEAILAREKPLGDILNQHRVLTRVEPSWYLRFEPKGVLADCFGHGVGAALYGRVATICFHDQPAVELLEIVTDRRCE